MIQRKTYVNEDEHGCLRIGDSDVSLDSVVLAYQQGYTAETIQQLYSALTLEEVYGAVAFYLANRDDVDRYLQQQDARWQQLRDKAAQQPSPVIARLRAQAAPSVVQHHS